MRQNIGNASFMSVLFTGNEHEGVYYTLFHERLLNYAETMPLSTCSHSKVHQRPALEPFHRINISPRCLFMWQHTVHCENGKQVVVNA